MSTKADVAFCRILEFYIQRNGNNNYIRKISKEITDKTKLYFFNPQLGQLSDFPNIRVVVKGNNKIFYEI